MKNLFTVVLIAISAIAGSQNWQPVNPDYTYFYKTTEDEYISNTIFVDSIVDINGQQVYLLNTVMELCDTCENIDCYTFMDYFLPSGPNFLQKEVHQSGGNKTIFKKRNDFVILHMAGLNQSWLFDTLQNITANISQISFDEIFPGTYDSVKNIQLSNSNQIKLTKNYGILEFPDFYYTGNNYFLQGGRTSDSVFGEEVLDYWDIFDFEVGDIFCKFKWEGGIGDSKPPVYNTMTKIEILTTEIINNNIVLSRFVKKRKWDSYGSYNNCFEYYDSQTIYNNSSKLYNTLPGMASNDNSRKIASLKPNPFDGSLSIASVAAEVFKCDFYDNIYYDNIGTMSMYYAQGLGKVYHSVGMQGGSFEEQTVGYIRNADTIGEIYPDSIFLTTSIKEIAADDIHLFPVPASQTINIILPKYQNECLLELLDMRTRVLLKKTFRQTSEMKLDISNIEKGVYLLKIQFNNQTYLKKIIKS